MGEGRLDSADRIGVAFFFFFFKLGVGYYFNGDLLLKFFSDLAYMDVKCTYI